MSEKPSDMTVWNVCRWLRMHDNQEIIRCAGCPEWQQDEHYGRVKRGCRGLAEEVIDFATSARDWSKRGGPLRPANDTGPVPAPPTPRREG